MPPRTKREKPRTPKPRPSAFVSDTPCEHCGCQWAATAVDLDKGDLMTVCANPYCAIIQQLRAMLLEVSKLAADTPQFDNPLHIHRAKKIRDAVLAGKVRIAATPTGEQPNG